MNASGTQNSLVIKSFSSVSYIVIIWWYTSEQLVLFYASAAQNSLRADGIVLEVINGKSVFKAKRTRQIKCVATIQINRDCVWLSEQ